MRADSAGAKTWLLAAVAGWALVVWVLGLFNLGGRITPLADNSSLQSRLPQPAAAPAERLGTLAQYSEIGTRPLFAEDRQPQPFFINPSGEGEQANAFDFVLTSVLLTPQLTMAILQPSAGGDPVRLKVGDAPDATPGWVLASVAERSAVFNGPEGEKTLELRVFDGTGGQPPTASAGPVVDGAAPSRRPMPVLPPNAPQPAPVANAVPPPDPAVDGTPAQQADAIRARIEARRQQLQQEAQRAAAQAKTP